MKYKCWEFTTDDDDDEGISIDPARPQPSLDPLCQPLGGRDGVEGGGKIRRVVGKRTRLGIPGLKETRWPCLKGASCLEYGDVCCDTLGETGVAGRRGGDSAIIVTCHATPHRLENLISPRPASYRAPRILIAHSGFLPRTAGSYRAPWSFIKGSHHLFSINSTSTESCKSVHCQ